MSQRVGVWIVGILGEVASATILGAKAIAAGYSGATGLVTGTEPFEGLKLVSLSDLVFGGHDLVQEGLYQRVRDYSRANRIFDPDQLTALRDGIEAIEPDVRPGTSFRSGEAVTGGDDPAVSGRRERPEEIVARLAGEMKAFQEKHRLGKVVVVHLASAESGTGEAPPESMEAWREAVRDPFSKKVTASMLYACAAIRNGFPYLNFTSSPGSSPKALQDLALEQGVPHYGNDGKTGETLVKTVLAPLFTYRNLKVLSWEGYNLLGNDDGRVLQFPAHKEAKVRHKEDVLPAILGYSPHARVSIDYVPSLGDWKTAWDFIHFKGFLETPMSLQFTWQGCDSILAAPLVLDLVRLLDLAARNGEKGLMTHLACFFKDPMGVAEQRLSHQYEALVRYAERHAAGGKIS
ncbi:MAG: inositol-3-phosphate synthase [Nitrospirae bacterium]|nr:inositol-3-phosphate synthase [Nitrospirota bacterium]